jgi:hypothetical protein
LGMGGCTQPWSHCRRWQLGGLPCSPPPPPIQTRRYADIRNMYSRLSRPAPCVTKIVQGWPKLWANFRALIGIFSQNFGPSLAIWVNPVQFSFVAHGAAAAQASRLECGREGLKRDELLRAVASGCVACLLPGPRGVQLPPPTTTVAHAATLLANCSVDKEFRQV